MSIIVLGSLSPFKRQSLDEALRGMNRLRVTQVVCADQPSGVSDAPSDRVQTMRGAINRALANRILKGSYGLGLEGGNDVIEIDDQRRGFGISVVALARPGEEPVLLEGLAIPIPIEYIDETRRRNGTHTLGQIVAEHLGGDPRDPYMALTRGKISRVDTFVPAIVAGLRMVGF